MDIKSIRTKLDISQHALSSLSKIPRWKIQLFEAFDSYGDPIQKVTKDELKQIKSVFKKHAQIRQAFLKKLDQEIEALA